MPPVTARIPGNGSTSVSYTIPGAGLDVETVRVSVDATAAAGAVTATVTITDQSGVVIATKPQNATIPAGAIGSATWALRLDDDTAGGGGTDPLAVHYDTSPQTGTFLESTTSNNLTLENSGPGQVNISSDDGAFGGGFIGLTTANGEVFIGSTSIVNRTANSGAFEVQRSGSSVVVRVFDDGSAEIRLASGKQLNVYGPFSKKIMRITDGGGGAATYEIQTGQVWQSTL